MNRERAEELLNDYLQLRAKFGLQDYTKERVEDFKVARERIIGAMTRGLAKPTLLRSAPAPAPAPALDVTRSLDDPCPHPERNGRHEVYVQGAITTDRRAVSAYCRACGAKGEITLDK